MQTLVGRVVGGNGTSGMDENAVTNASDAVENRNAMNSMVDAVDAYFHQ